MKVHILYNYGGTDNLDLTDEQYEALSNAACSPTRRVVNLGAVAPMEELIINTELIVAVALIAT